MKPAPIVALVFCLLAPIVGSAAEGEDAELQRVQGRFERQFRNPAGVAYRAKPIVAAAAQARIDHADLTALLYFQGYTERDIVSG